MDPADRQRIATELGYSETIFVGLPEAGANTAVAHIFTPAAELPFAGHPTVGASWWLQAARDAGQHVAGARRRGAGGVPVADDGEFTAISARSEWAPDFSIYDLDSIDEVLAADPDDYSDDVEHYLWAWIDKARGHHPVADVRQPSRHSARTRRPARRPCASPTTSAAT